MSQSRFTLPVDFETSESFRRLSAQLQDTSRAVVIYVRLFRDLTYSAREGRAAGWIDESDAGLYESSLALKLDDLAGESALLVRKDHRYFCPAYAECNPGAVTPRERKGPLAKRYLNGVRRGLASLGQQSLLIPADRLLDDKGVALTSEQVQRVRMLILCCDQSLGKLGREGWEYSETLIQNASRVLARYTDEEIDRVCKTVAMAKGHPFLAGIETEKFLAPDEHGRCLFDSVMGKIGGEG